MTQRGSNPCDSGRVFLFSGLGEPAAGAGMAFARGCPPEPYSGDNAMKRRSPIPNAKNDAVWAATAKLPVCRRLTTNIKCDVCIVGGGISGLTTGYLLGKAGKKVAIFDDGPLASGMTHVTTAHLTNAIDDRFINIERWHGEEGAKLAAQSHAAAIDRIEQIAGELGVDCDFRRLDGYLMRDRDDGEGDDLLDRELAAAKRAGVRGVELEARAPIEDFESGPALRFPDQARFHPFKYLDAVARAIKKQGGRIYGNSHVDAVEGGDPAKVTVGEFTVTAKAVVVATNSPINDLIAIHTKQAPYMTYVIGCRVPNGSVEDVLLWDTLEAYHYVRLQPMPAKAGSDGAGEGYDLLIVGGEDHKSGQGKDKDEPHQRLLTWARRHYPMIEKVEFTWGGQCMETADGLAFIGRNPLDKENVYIVTGDSGMGMTHGTIAGMLLTDLILGRANPWEQLYDPSRKPVRAAGTFVKENLNVAAQYADWVTPGEVSSVDEIAPGTGAVLRRGMTKVAVSRDEKGEVTELSAVCPHLQCVVHWNQAETTWDCPCHGSRFHADGECINGPANKDLAPVGEPAEAK
jgi:glycine/D-amino acid oxidase-like deaminating enzyme/nitrite reductase/ring-hydroxylating ferredoxin subunit